MDKLTGPDSGLLGVLLPLGLGVAAAAHPALARGAGAITQSMAMAGRNRRLKDVVEMEKAREGRAAEQYTYAKGQRPMEEKRKQYGPLAPTGGGGYGHMNWQTGQFEPVVPQYAGSEAEQQALRTRGKIKTEQDIEHYKALSPYDIADFQKKQDIMLKRQKELQETKPPMNENTALGRIMQIENQMAQDIQKFRSTKNEEEEYPTEAQVEAYVRQAHARYAPEVQSLYGYMPKGYHKRTFMDAPPLGYIRSNYTDPELGQVWIDPNDPGNRAKWWVPKVPWSGGLY